MDLAGVFLEEQILFYILRGSHLLQGFISGLPFCLSQVGEPTVLPNLAQPYGQPAFSLKGGAVFNGTAEGFLGQFFRQRLVSAESCQIAVHHGELLFVQLVKIHPHHLAFCLYDAHECGLLQNWFCLFVFLERTTLSLVFEMASDKTNFPASTNRRLLNAQLVVAAIAASLTVWIAVSGARMMVAM